jgi:predicted nucleic acid-binding protein
VTFVDTNVLAHAHDRSEPRKQAVAQAQLEVLWRDRTGALSTQVLQELYVVTTRRLQRSMHRATARTLVALYAEWPVVQIDVPLILAASEPRSAMPSRSGTPSSWRQPGAPARPGC